MFLSMGWNIDVCLRLLFNELTNPKACESMRERMKLNNVRLVSST